MIEDLTHKLLSAVTAGKLMEIITAGLLASMGGAAQSLYSHVRGDKPLSFGLFMVNLFLAFFVGQVVGSFIPHNFAYRDGILLVAGFTTYPILGVLQDQGGAIVARLVGKINPTSEYK